MTVAREFARYGLDLVRLCDGRNDVVTTAIRYGLDGPGIESQWGRYIQRPSRPALWPTQTPIQWVPGLSWG